MPSPIRLFQPETSAGLLDEVCACQSVTVRLGDILPILLQAAQNRRNWVEDFCDDPVEISQDLYEVLLAYQQHREAA